MPRWSPAAPSPSAGVSSCACSRPAVCGSPSAGTRGCCTPRPPWLPAGSRVDVISSRQDGPPASTAVVRLLAHTGVGARRQPTRRLDLPSRAVGDATAEEALGELQREVLGDQEGAELVGYVRNTVPAGDTSYPAGAAGLLRGLRPGGSRPARSAGATGSPSTRPPNASPRGTGGYCCPSSSATRGTGTVAGRERGGDQLAGRNGPGVNGPGVNGPRVVASIPEVVFADGSRAAVDVVLDSEPAPDADVFAALVMIEDAEGSFALVYSPGVPSGRRRGLPRAGGAGPRDRGPRGARGDRAAP